MTGSPLSLSIQDVYIVLGAKEVDWNDELALRQAKELLLIIMHNLWNPYHIEVEEPCFY